jgi:hypothetical protein
MNVVDVPVLHLEHEHAAVWIEDDEVGMARLAADRDVVPKAGGDSRGDSRERSGGGVRPRSSTSCPFAAEASLVLVAIN